MIHGCPKPPSHTALGKAVVLLSLPPSWDAVFGIQWTAFPGLGQPGMFSALVEGGRGHKEWDCRWEHPAVWMMSPDRCHLSAWLTTATGVWIHCFSVSGNRTIRASSSQERKQTVSESTFPKHLRKINISHGLLLLLIPFDLQFFTYEMRNWILTPSAHFVSTY